MTLAPIESPSRAASSAKVELTETAGPSNSRPGNSEFGHIMSEVLQSGPPASALPAGQEVAAGAALQAEWPGALGGNLGASFGGELLKAVHLGPHMNVITSEATVPDEQSLEAFARSQGLDETAVQWLMGSSQPLSAPPPMSATVATTALNSASLIGANFNSANLNSANLNSANLNSANLNSANFNSATPDSAINASSLTTGIDPLQTGQLTTPAGTMPLGSASPMGTIRLPTTPTAPPETTLTADLGQSLAPSPHGMPRLDGSKPEGGFYPNALNAAALWAMAQGTEKTPVTAPTRAPEDSAEVAQVQINLLASPAPPAFWMLRNPLAAAPTKETAPTPSGISVSEIDLSQAATPELLDSLSQALAEGASLQTAAGANEPPAPVAGHPGHRVDLATAARQDAQNAQASASAPDSAHAQRTENIQNLAEKMGQAVGQRILSEIEKGQWHLKLSLRPATLGHIEVEMRMRSGEMDAVFTAPQALTRELLQEGMSKLKDTLTQMGMDVASMQVGDGQTQKRGGESTPGQMSKSTNSGSDDPQSSLSAPPVPAPRMKMGQDGWDVLV